jgi:hypothetical protein
MVNRIVDKKIDYLVRSRRDQIFQSQADQIERCCILYTANRLVENRDV